MTHTDGMMMTFRWTEYHLQNTIRRAMGIYSANASLSFHSAIFDRSLLGVQMSETKDMDGSWVPGKSVIIHRDDTTGWSFQVPGNHHHE